MKVGILYVAGSCRKSKDGVKSWFEEQNVPEAVFAKRLCTARGLGLGFEDLSRRETRIPRNVRKKTTTNVIVVMKRRFLVMDFSRQYLIQIHNIVNIYTKQSGLRFSHPPDPFFGFDHAVDNSGST